MRQYLYFSVLVSSLLFGCGHFRGTSPGDFVIAKVGDKTLLRKELSSSLPSGITKPDSISQAKFYIQRWIRQELMLKMAEENLADEQKDVQRELDEYRTSLIIHRYQQQLINQKLDTAIAAGDILNFYNSHPEKFTLDQNIVKAIYLEVPKKEAKLDQLKHWMTASDDKSRMDLEKFSFQYATKFDYFNEEWIDFSQIRSRMPVSFATPDVILKRNSFIESTDENKYYLAAIKDYRLIGDKAPFEFVKDRIASLILNTRKIEFIEELQKNIFQKAKSTNQFKIND